MQSLQSKTVIGLVLILGVAIFMSFMGKLSPEMVDVLKWSGTAFMAVRGVANYTENKA